MRQSEARQASSLLTIGLPVVVLVLVAALAYKAETAQRSRRATAESTLHDFAKFAAWEYADRARNTVLTAIITPFIYPVANIDPSLPSSKQPSPADFAAAARDRGNYCGCIDDSAVFFRYDWRDSTFVTDRELPGELERWVRDTSAAHERRFERPTRLVPLTYGGAGAPFKRLSVVLTNDSYVTVYDSLAGRSWVVAYVLSRDFDNSPVVTYGFVEDARSFAVPLFESVFRRESLFPEALVDGAPNDSVLRVTVRTASGQTLYRSSAGTRGFVAWDTLDASYGELALGITLKPEVADELVVGGLPRSQRPLLIGLVLLTSAMLIGAVVHLRRQQELVRLRANFISGVSHELRTPLTQIRLFAELLHTGDLRSDSDRARAARVVDQEARRLTYLVENVLAFSRHERHQERVVREHADVSQELREALELFTPVARARGVMLALDAPETLEASVDTNALRQIVLNLLDNAVKYGPDDQTVTVSAEVVGDSAIRVAVEDQGPGVPPESRESIWEPYERLPRDQASAVGGSGIGLAVVRDLARLHGGRTWVERAVGTKAGSGAGADGRGGGSRFVVELATGDEHHESPGDPNGISPALAVAHGERT